MKKTFLLIPFLIFSFNANLTAINSGITDVNKYDENGNTPLHVALNDNNLKLAETLLNNNNINVNLQDANGDTALHLAIKKSADKLIPLLIELGADITIKNTHFVSPTVLAACYEKKEILKLFFKDKDPLLKDFLKTIKYNDIKAFNLLLGLSKTNIFTDKDNGENILFDSIISGNKDFIDICIANTGLTNDYIFGYNPLHLAAMYDHYELVKYFVEKCNANINAFDYDGLTPLHYAVMYGNYEITNYLINKKCSINEKSLKDIDLYKKGSTCLDFATQFGHNDIIKLLSQNKAKKNIVHEKNIITDQTDYLAIFIDYNTERTKPDEPLASVNTAFSAELHDIIKQEACPIIIISQHLLKNALQLSCSLKNWFIVEISDHNAISGYFIIPKKFNNNLESLDTKILDLQLQNLGYDFSLINHNYVNESNVINKTTCSLSVKKSFNKTAVSIINNILLPHQRFIYWGGHGNSGKRRAIGGLSAKNASNLFNILSNKNTKIVYVSTCFFGGKNYEIIKDLSGMVVISSATTEIISSSTIETKPHNWCSFFNTLSKYQDYSNFNNYCECLSNQVLPFINTHNPNISNFPHVKIPGKQFTLLNIGNKAILINKETIANNKNSLLLIDNKKLLEVDLEEIKKPLKIKNEIPLIISNNYKNTFEKIIIDNIKNTSNNDFINIAEKLTMPNIFKDSSLENNFLIKELILPTEFKINTLNKKNLLIKRLYNVLIYRGPNNKCGIFLSINKNLTINNSILIVYDNDSKKWNAHADLSEEDFNLYKKLLDNASSIIKN